LCQCCAGLSTMEPNPLAVSRQLFDLIFATSQKIRGTKFLIY
jgi:hypothetical protein